MTPALLPAQGRRGDGPRQSDPPPANPPGHSSGEGASQASPPPPPPAKLTCRRQAAKGARGCPTTPAERVHLRGKRRRRRGDWAVGHRPSPPEEGGGEPQRDPPPLSPHSPTRTRGPRGRRPPTPPKAGDGLPSLRQDHDVRGGRCSRAHLHAPSRLLPQELRWTSKSAPAHKGATRTAPGDSKRARTRAVWGPRPPWPERRLRHPLCCLPREGRRTDRGKATSRPTDPPAAPLGGTPRRPPPPQTPPRPLALERHRHADPPHEGRTAPSQEEGKRDRAAPPAKQAKRSTAPRQDTLRSTDRVERPYQRPAAGPREVRAPHQPGEGRGAAWTPREREGTHTQRTRGEYQKGNRTEPAERTDCMEWRTSERG